MNATKYSSYAQFLGLRTEAGTPAVRIDRIALDGLGSNPPLYGDSQAGQFPHANWLATGVAPALNVIPFDRPEALELVGTLLWGGAADRAATPSGEIDLASGADRLRLSCTWLGGRPRLTAANMAGGRLGPADVERMGAGASRDLLATVLHFRGRDPNTLEKLLSASAARAMRQHESDSIGSLAQSGPQGGIQDRVDRDPRHQDRHFQELLDRRDSIAATLEQELAGARLHSVELDRRIADLAASRGPLVAELADLEEGLRGITATITSAEAQARYAQIAQAARGATDGRLDEDSGRRLAELDQQIERWRGTLADLQRREAAVRGELANLRPEESRPGVALADLRASLAVARRLMRDLEGEVARFARAAGPGVCLCRDAHPRLDPLVETLGENLDGLSVLVEQQHRALRWGQLEDEARHVARSQAELRDQLECLLGQREEIVRSSRARVEPAPLERRPELDPEAWNEAHNRRRGTIERIQALQRTLQSLDNEIEALRQQRTEGFSARLDGLREELRQIERALAAGPARPAPRPRSRWRASDVLAKLSDGRLRQLALTAGGRQVLVIDSAGRSVAAGALTLNDRQLVTLALALAMAADLRCRGVQHPMLLDEPFAGLDPQSAAIAAGVLQDFAKLSELQLLLTTANGFALERFRMVGARILEGTAPAVAPVHREQPREPISVAPVPPQRVRVQSAALLRTSDPIERFPVRLNGREGVFVGSDIQTVGDLLAHSPEAVSQSIQKLEVPAELVSLWQSHVGLVCFVPGLTLGEAQLLTNLGFATPQAIAEAEPQRLADAVATVRGHQDRAEALRTAERWVQAARGARPGWGQDSAYLAWAGRGASAPTRVARAPRRERGASSLRASGTPELRIKKRREHSVRPAVRDNDGRRAVNGGPSRQSSVRTAIKFHLDLSSPLENAPSIGAKLAEELQRIGLVRVSELLAADPTATAKRLDCKGVSAETVVAWQQQAKLVCRLPGIRGHDAQILVASGFTAPEEIARMKPEDLLAFIDPFCESLQGQRVLRSSPRPDLAEVAQWIEAARQARSLGAA